MSDTTKTAIGSIVWRDLTVKDAEGVQQFYREVVGWETAHHNMGEYDDFDVKLPESGEVVAGICHALGENASVPPQWLMYVAVEDVDRSAERCRQLGGEVVDGPRMMGRSRFCVVRDPAGAVIALVSDGEKDE
jgi:predicted enzyme related to lactoylglutathione lyase